MSEPMVLSVFFVRGLVGTFLLGWTGFVMK
jgi:hypothetical protein